MSVESRECLLVAESCVVPDHEVQMGQREEGRALQVGEIDVQSCGVWRLPEAFRQCGLELLDQKASHGKGGGDQVRKEFETAVRS